MSVETKLARFFSTKHACERMTVVTQEGTAKTAAVERQMRVGQRHSERHLNLPDEDVRILTGTPIEDLPGLVPERPDLLLIKQVTRE